MYVNCFFEIYLYYISLCWWYVFHGVEVPISGCMVMPVKCYVSWRNVVTDNNYNNGEIRLIWCNITKCVIDGVIMQFCTWNVQQLFICLVILIWGYCELNIAILSFSLLLVHHILQY